LNPERPEYVIVKEDATRAWGLVS